MPENQAGSELMRRPFQFLLTHGKQKIGRMPQMGVDSHIPLRDDASLPHFWLAGALDDASVPPFWFVRSHSGKIL